MISLNEERFYSFFEKPYEHLKSLIRNESLECEKVSFICTKQGAIFDGETKLHV